MKVEREFLAFCKNIGMKMKIFDDDLEMSDLDMDLIEEDDLLDDDADEDPEEPLEIKEKPVRKNRPGSPGTGSGKRKKKKKKKNGFFKILPVLIAVLLIAIVVGAFYGQKLMEKYSYGTERADLNEYFKLESGYLSVVFNAERIGEKAKLIDGKPYFTSDFVKERFTDHFYANPDESEVLYTTHEQTIQCLIGKEFRYYLTKEEKVDLDYLPVVLEGDTLYYALDYLALFVKVEYDIYTDPGYIVIYTKEPEITVASMKTDSAVRSLGGIKAPILDDLSNGEKIYVIEEMEDWAKVIDQRGFIGYVEIKQYDVLDEPAMVMGTEEPAFPLLYQEITFDGKINMAFHQVFAAPESHFTEDMAQVKSVNVVAPTLYRIDAGDDLIKALPAAEYVRRAHEKGIQVWASWVDVDLNLSTVDEKRTFMAKTLNSSVTRKKLIDEMIERSTEAGIDGINIDFEYITTDSGDAFTQFLRELSLRTHEEGIILSVDNYAISDFHPAYNLEEEGKVVDYICLMGYDENQSRIGSNASIDFVERGIRETLQIIPASKVINIVPFYTRLWRITDENTFSADVISMKVQGEWIEQVGAGVSWDNETCQNYAEAVVGGKTCRLWMEDADSLEVKLNVMDTYGVAGVAEWKLGFETPDVWDVFEKYMQGTLNPEAQTHALPEEAASVTAPAE